MKVKVTLEGCDDNNVVELNVSQREFRFMEWLRWRINKASTSSCEPTMKVEILDV